MIPENLPLQYVFTYSFDLFSEFILKSRNARNKVTASFPSQSSTRSSNISILCQVYDVLNSSNSLMTTIRILPNTLSYSNLSLYSNQRLKLGLSTENYDFVFQTINTVSSTLNQVNCSTKSVEYCSSLNRMECLTTAQTCGNCLDGYSGVEGASNSICQIDALPVGTKCSENEQCVYGICEANTCIVPKKSCPTNNEYRTCSGNGECTYFDILSRNICQKIECRECLWELVGLTIFCLIDVIYELKLENEF